MYFTVPRQKGEATFCVSVSYGELWKWAFHVSKNSCNEFGCMTVMADLHEVCEEVRCWSMEIADSYVHIYTQCEKACVVTRLAALNYCLFKCLHWHWEANLVFAFTILKCRRKKPYKTSSVYSFPVYIHLASRWGAGDVGTHGGRCAILCVLLWGVLQLVRRLSFWVA